jgi:hypothetical protein
MKLLYYQSYLTTNMSTSYTLIYFKFHVCYLIKIMFG